MLTISQAQWRLMEERFGDMTVLRVMEELWEVYPESCQQLGDEALPHLVDGAVCDAQALNLTAFRDYCAFAALRLHKSDFDQSPHVKAILEEVPDAEDTRMVRVLELLQGEGLVEVRQ